MSVPPITAFVDLAAQHAEVGEEVVGAMAAVMAGGAFIGGPQVAEFERAWAAFCGARHAVGVANGTDAIEVALRSLGIGHGDEVLVPTNSFAASAGAVVRAGATPVFVDCDRRHLLVDCDRLGEAVGPRTAAVLPVHLYGQMAPMERVGEVADRHGLAVVEDAAQAHGATRHGRPPGSWGAAAAYSFYPGKNLGAYGDAGALTTDDDTVAATARQVGNHGGTVRYQHERLGFNSRLDTMQAVVLSAKLGRLAAWNSERRHRAQRYAELLGGVPGVELPAELDGNLSVWHLYVIRVEERDRLAAHLASAGVPTGIHYPSPLHLLGAFAGLGHGPGDFPVAEGEAHRLLSLPMHPHLPAQAQDRIAEVVAEALG